MALNYVPMKRYNTVNQIANNVVGTTNIRINNPIGVIPLGTKDATNFPIIKLHETTKTYKTDGVHS